MVSRSSCSEVRQPRTIKAGQFASHFMRWFSSSDSSTTRCYANEQLAGRELTVTTTGQLVIRSFIRALKYTAAIDMRLRASPGPLILIWSKKFRMFPYLISGESGGSFCAAIAVQNSPVCCETVSDTYMTFWVLFNWTMCRGSETQPSEFDSKATTTPAVILT